MKIINKILTALIIIPSLIILLIDKESLNSLLINTKEIEVNRVAMLNVDSDKIIYNDIELAKKQQQQTTTTTTATNSWSWPTDGNYVITTSYSSSHKAIDIAGPGNGSNIYAANNGVVTVSNGGCIPGNLSCNGRAGNYVVINHNNGYYTVYMHLKSINVNVGQTVSKGQVIGKMGNTGNVIPAPTSTSSPNGTHLHFCLYKGVPYQGGYELNPMSLY